MPSPTRRRQWKARAMQNVPGAAPLRTASSALSSCLGFGESAMSKRSSLGAGDVGAAGCSFRRAPRPCASGFPFPVAGITSCYPAIFRTSGKPWHLFLRGLTTKSGRKAIKRARIAHGRRAAGCRNWRGPAHERAGAGHPWRCRYGSALSRERQTRPPPSCRWRAHVPSTGSRPRFKTRTAYSRLDFVRVASETCVHGHGRGA